MTRTNFVTYAETVADMVAIVENLIAQGVEAFDARLLREHNVYEITWTPPAQKEGDK